MDGSATGRRRDRDGAITVTELIRREPGWTARAHLADELLAYSSEQDDPTPAPLASRLLFGTFGFGLLLVSAVITSMILAHPLPRADGGGAVVRGVVALRPDLVRDASWPFSPGLPDDVPSAPAAAVRERSDTSAFMLADELYRRLGSDPEGAVRLLSPELVDGQEAELAGAWREATAVRARPVSAVPGGVIAEVELDYGTGDRVLLRHLLTVEVTGTPRISGAELLAARHFDPG
ncbi:hypothetical protein GCM10010470_49520 [Saccharopolyspora taberi]|uniref:Uncharacterized protein n=1 Tax=Saccharopolyspora taberi TaxID=60895 RepID=A0ABN3VIY3_9PSEU